MDIINRKGGTMAYCFYCRKEVDDEHICPECGRKLFPDVKFSEHKETYEEKVKKEIRRKKLEEAHKKEIQKKMYLSKDDIDSKKAYKEIPANFTSVRDNIRFKEKKGHPEWEKEEVKSHKFLTAFRYMLLFVSTILILMILDFYGYTIEVQGFEFSILPDMTSNVFLTFFLLIFIFMIVLPLLIVTITTGSSYDVRKRR